MIKWIKGLWFEFVILWETLIDTTDSYHDMSDEIEKATKQVDDMYDKHTPNRVVRKEIVYTIVGNKVTQKTEKHIFAEPIDPTVMSKQAVNKLITDADVICSAHRP